MGSIVGPAIIIVLIIVGIPLALAVAAFLGAAGLGLLYRGAAGTPPSPARQHAAPVAAPAVARPVTAFRRVLRRVILVLGGFAALAVGLGCLWPVVVFLATFGPRMLSDLRGVVAEKREKATLDPALENVRRFVEAEAAYRTRSGDSYATPECLARPALCLPGYTGAPFLDEARATLGSRGGFVWTFQPGRASDAAGTAGGTRLTGYALVGVPLRPFAGASSVCGDASGQVCTFQGRVQDGDDTCPRACVQHSW